MSILSHRTEAMGHTQMTARRRHAQSSAVLMFVVLHVCIFCRAQSCGPAYEEINGLCEVCPVGTFKAANGDSYHVLSMFTIKRALLRDSPCMYYSRYISF